MSIDRLPPQDIDTEIACLASALLSREGLFKVTEILHPEDFYLESNRTIFETILELESKNLPIDLPMLKQRLEDTGKLEKIGGEKTLVELYQSASTSANAGFYANRIKELSLRRNLIRVTTSSIEKCYDMSMETDELIDDVERNIFKVTEKKDTTSYRGIDEVIDDTLKNIIKWNTTKKLVTGIASGFKDLDEKLTGFHGSELIIVAARPGMGKTALALNIMNHVALKEVKPVLFFSLEMPAVQLGMRMLCIESMVDSQLVRTGYTKKEELEKIFQVSNNLAQSPIYIDDTPSMTILQIMQKARRLATKEPLGMIVVDYLQLISSMLKAERHQQIAEISRMLKQLARELDVPVIALSQLSRAVESRVDQIPNLSDLRESGAIEQDADVVLFIYREEKVKKESEKKGIADIIIAKQRNGPTGTIPLKFWEQYTKFSNLSKAHSYDEAFPSNELN